MEEKNLNVKLQMQNFHLFYGDFRAVKDVSVDVYEKQITAIIGPSGCGKSTLLRSFNRMNDLIPDTHVEGTVRIDGTDVYTDNTDVVALRKRIGMVFQRPNPFPKSIYDNVAYGPRIHGLRDGSELDDLVERSLRQAAVWEDVKDDLKKSAMALSGGQQQRLCIARTLAVEPDVILMDEPCSALDPIATLRIEDLMRDLKKDYTIVIVTHNMQQAGRVSDYTLFMMMNDDRSGGLVEYGETDQIFTNPQKQQTEDYITGRFG
jgi:phosphate transport system ATP-binding protein